MEMAQTVEKGAKDTKEGSDAFKPIEGLYELADEEAPPKLENLGVGLASGAKTAEDENNMLGDFTKTLKQYTKKSAP